MSVDGFWEGFGDGFGERAPIAAPDELRLDELRITAEMARLHLDDAELAGVAGELSRFFGFAARLREVDVTGILPTTHALPLVCPLRDDVVGAELESSQILGQAPASSSGFFTVPAILPTGANDGGQG